MALTDVTVARLDCLERRFLSAVSSGEILSLQPVLSRYQVLFAHATHASTRVEPPVFSQLVRLATRIKVVSAALADLDKGCKQIEGDCRHTANALCRAQRLSSASDGPPPDPLDDPAAFAPYRRWFVDHFAITYPSPKDKEALLAQVPRHNKTQLDTWFVNTRRRSGWQALRRAHTNGSVEDMVRLLRDVDEGAPNVGEDLRRKVERIKAFFYEGARDKVSDEIQAIVRDGVLAPPLAPAERARRRLDHRAARGVGASATGGGGSSALSSPPSELSAPRSRRARTPPLLARASSGAYAGSPSEMSPLAAFDDAPRYPSTFSSPASSTARTVSDSSSASFDSLVSYASAESAYYDAPAASSPPATSSLLSFAGSLPSSSSAHLPPPHPVSFRPRAGRAAPYPPSSSRPHPYFCTVNELPTSSTLAGFAARR